MKFYRISKREFILSAADRWAMLNTETARTSDDQGVLRKLQELDLHQASEDDVARIVGHHGLTGLICDICHYEVDEALIYEDPQHEPHSFCQACFGEAIRVFGQFETQRQREKQRARGHLRLVKNQA